MTAVQPEPTKHRSQPRAVAVRRLRPVAAGISVLITAVVVFAAVFTVAQGVMSVPTAAAGPAAVPVGGVGAVQTLYAQDLVARINAERAARDTLLVNVPPLQVDGGLAAYAQSWSAHLAALNTVADPSLSTCRMRRVWPFSTRCWLRPMCSSRVCGPLR